MFNPLQFFEVGQQLGNTNSPVGGVNQVLKSVLANAESQGLIQQKAFYDMMTNQMDAATQHGYRTEELGMQHTNKLDEMDHEANMTPAIAGEDPNNPYFVADPKGNQLMREDVYYKGHPVGKKFVKTQPLSLFSMMEGLMDDGSQQSPDQGAPVNKFDATADELLNYLKNQGG